MNDARQLAVERIVSAYRRGRTLILLLDYDGTLAPAANEPALAVLGAERREVLATLSGITHIFVGVISGRPLADLQRLIGLPMLYYAGTGGMEIDLRGEMIRHPAEIDAIALMRLVANDLDAAIAEWPAALVERKAAGLTVHWGQVEAAERDSLRAAMLVALRTHSSQLRVIEGRYALDLLPRNGWHKGSAVDQIVAHVAAVDPLVIYAGDQPNDRYPFESVRNLDGITIAVGPDAPPMASYHLPNPDTLGDLLWRLATTVANQPAAPPHPIANGERSGD